MNCTGNDENALVLRMSHMDDSYKYQRIIVCTYISKNTAFHTHCLSSIEDRFERIYFGTFIFRVYVFRVEGIWPISYGSTSMSDTVWIILYDWHSWTYVCMLSDFCGINMLCTFRLVVYCFFNCIFKISECSNVKASITCYGSKDFWAGDSTLKF